VGQSVGMNSLKSHMELVRERFRIYGHPRVRFIGMIMIVVHNVNSFVVLCRQFRALRGFVLVAL